MSLYCSRCEAAFDGEADDPRCPRCLRKTTVVDPSAPRTTSGEVPVLPTKPFWPRFAIALPSCCFLFFGVTFTMSFGGIELSWALRLYVTLLGGLLLALTATVFQLPGMFASFGPRPPAPRSS